LSRWVPAHPQKKVVTRQHRAAALLIPGPNTPHRRQSCPQVRSRRAGAHAPLRSRALSGLGPSDKLVAGCAHGRRASTRCGRPACGADGADGAAHAAAARRALAALVAAVALACRAAAQATCPNAGSATTCFLGGTGSTTVLGRVNALVPLGVSPWTPTATTTTSSTGICATSVGTCAQARAAHRQPQQPACAAPESGPWTLLSDSLGSQTRSWRRPNGTRPSRLFCAGC
jgi:hypothetical protein